MRRAMIAAVLALGSATCSAQDYRIPERDWDEQKRRDEERQRPACRPQIVYRDRVVYVQQQPIYQPVYQWVLIGWDYHAFAQISTPRYQLMQVR